MSMRHQIIVHPITLNKGDGFAAGASSNSAGALDGRKKR